MAKGGECLSVYPNPVTGNTINLNMNTEKGTNNIVINDNIGQQLFNKIINHSGGSATQTLKLDNSFITGTYHLQLKKNMETKTIKVIKL